MKPMPAPAKNRQMLRFGTFLALNFAAMGMATPAIAQPQPASAPQASGIRGFSYADLADLTLTAQVVAGITVVKAERLKGELAPNLAAGKARFLIEAQT